MIETELLEIKEKHNYAENQDAGHSEIMVHRDDSPTDYTTAAGVTAAPSDFQLFMVTVKLFFGISYLSMPNTFAHCGMFGGILLFSIVIGMNGITMLQLLKTSE